MLDMPLLLVFLSSLLRGDWRWHLTHRADGLTPNLLFLNSSSSDSDAKLHWETTSLNQVPESGGETRQGCCVQGQHRE